MAPIKETKEATNLEDIARITETKEATILLDIATKKETKKHQFSGTLHQ